MKNLLIVKQEKEALQNPESDYMFPMMTLGNYETREEELLTETDEILITFVEQNKRKNAKAITAMIDKSTGCWINNSHNKEYNRYPRFERNSKTQSVHRYIYTIFYGEPGADKVICHTCDNTHCINPLHLVADTQAENLRQMKERGRSACGEKHWNAKLTNNDVIAILADDKSTNKELADRYCISEANIGRIKNGSLWKHINREDIKELTRKAA